MGDGAFLLGIHVDALEVAHRGGEGQDGVVGRGFDVDERTRLVEGEGTDPETTELAQVCTPAEGGAEVGGERTDIGAAAALHHHRGLGIGTRFEGFDLEAIDPRRAR